ncbi:unnamed protein product, partial [Prorocentrum cordatum]
RAVLLAGGATELESPVAAEAPFPARFPAAARAPGPRWSAPPRGPGQEACQPWRLQATPPRPGWTSDGRRHDDVGVVVRRLLVFVCFVLVLFVLLVVFIVNSHYQPLAPFYCFRWPCRLHGWRLLVCSSTQPTTYW